MSVARLGRPSFAQIRTAPAFQQELAWWAGASVRSLRARVSIHREWGGTATLTSTSPGQNRKLKGAEDGRTLADSTAAFTEVWGLDPLQAIDVRAVAAAAGCSERLAHRAMLTPLKPHLDRLRAEIDRQLTSPLF